MSRADELRDPPPLGDHEWPNYGEVHEHLRAGFLAWAEEAEADGAMDLGAQLRALADNRRRERNRSYFNHRRHMLSSGSSWPRGRVVPVPVPDKVEVAS